MNWKCNKNFAIKKIKYLSLLLSFLEKYYNNHNINIIIQLPFIYHY